jgi:hypothetical protein
MSERGVFAVDRGLFDHPSFAKEDFTEREAWIWLIKEAAWKGRTVRVGRAIIDLERGQLAASMRFMAKRWGWSEARVRRFLNRLENDALIAVLSDALATRITICKYNEYQRVSLPRDALGDALNVEEQTQNRRKPEDIKIIEGKKEEEQAPAGATVVAFPVKVQQKDVYAYGLKVLGKSAGGVISNLRKACEFDEEVAYEYLRLASEKHDGMAWIQRVLKASSAEGRAMRGALGAPDMEKPIPLKGEKTYADWRDDPLYRGVI